MSDHALPPGLRGYEFIRLLADGATASVYLYHQHIPSRDVAVKVSRSSLDEGAAARFINEANLMAQISEHPYILSVLGAGITDLADGYIVLEYAPGGSYKQLIRQHTLATDQMLDLGIKLGSALCTAHRKGIVHRDIKPGNVLISAQDLPQLADFGIATSIYQSSEQTGFSIPWAPPEVLLGRSAGDEAADIYSLGATLFATLCGSSPFEYGYHPSNQQELAHFITHEPIPSLTPFDVPPQIEYVLHKAMARDRDDRYASALEFTRALQRAQQQCFGHATAASIEGSSEFPSDLDHTAAARFDSPYTDAHSAQHDRTRRLAAGVALAVVAAAIVLVFATMIWPRLDQWTLAASTNISAQPGADTESPSPANGTPQADGPVPAPANLGGSFTADTVTFTWTNNAPRTGDTYAWKPIDPDDPDSFTPAQITTQPTATLKHVTDNQICIQVSIVRADRQMSQSPATACAIRHQ